MPFSIIWSPGKDDPGAPVFERTAKPQSQAWERRFDNSGPNHAQLEA